MNSAGEKTTAIIAAMPYSQQLNARIVRDLLGLETVLRVCTSVDGYSYVVRDIDEYANPDTYAIEQSSYGWRWCYFNINMQEWTPIPNICEAGWFYNYVYAKLGVEMVHTEWMKGCHPQVWIGFQILGALDVQATIDESHKDIKPAHLFWLGLLSMGLENRKIAAQSIHQGSYIEQHKQESFQIYSELHEIIYKEHELWKE